MACRADVMEAWGRSQLTSRGQRADTVTEDRQGPGLWGSGDRTTGAGEVRRLSGELLEP